MDTLAFLVWLPIAAVIFAVKKPHVAALTVLIVGGSYLPELMKVPLPVFPDLSKELLPPIAVLLLGMVFGKGLFRKLSLDGMARLLLLMVFISDVASVLLNRDAFSVGEAVIPAIETRTAITYVIEDWLTFFVPFLVGLAVVRHREWVADSVRTWLVLAAVYGLLVMYEARFSPQLHTKLYGYFQHDWIQMVRGGGFRPIVFMNHALEVALYMSMSTLLAALAMKRGKVIKSALPLLLYFVLCTLLCKSSGSIGMMMVGLGLLLFAKPVTQARVARVLVVLLLLVPLIRASGYFPSDRIITWATNLTNAERADSLAYRFRNDEELVERTMERPWFGWGGAARGFVYNPDGTTNTVVDGFWIIIFNARGFIGYYALFGLLVWPVFVANKRINKLERKDRTLLGGLTLVQGFYCFDLLVNGMYNAFPFLLGGMVFGVSRNAWQPLSPRGAMASYPAAARASIPAPAPGASGAPALPSG